jgi:prepilin-type N-terminal cleavage/methylation domain-containing protein
VPRGFSLIELMIALVAGLIVVGSVLAFTVATVRAYNENIRSTRLTHDLRTAMNLTVREIRRSGYDSTAVSRVLTDNNPAPSFAGISITASGDCVAYQYDRGDTLENRAIKLNATTGTLQAKISASAVSCADTSGWVDVSDPSVVDITGFKVVDRKYPFCSILTANETDPDPTKWTYARADGQVRSLSLCIKGRLRSDSSVVRSIADTSRSRAESVVFTPAAPSKTCANAPDPLDLPATLNNACGAL